MFKDGLTETIKSEEGHWAPFMAAVVAGVGAVALAIGSATDRGFLAIIGGIILALGFVAYDVVRHMVVDYEFFRRTDQRKDKG